MAFVDPVTIHNPTTGTAPPATWGDQLRDNDVYLHERGPYICTSGTRPGAPAEGYVIYETDTDRYYSWTGSAWVQMLATGAWTSWTPTLSQGVQPNITKAVNYAKYQKVGRLVTGAFHLLVSGAGDAGGVVKVSLPTGITPPAFSAPFPCGAGVITDASATTNYGATLVLFDTTTFAFIAHASAGYLGTFGFTLALANLDLVAGQFSFESTA